MIALSPGEVGVAIVFLAILAAEVVFFYLVRQ